MGQFDQAARYTAKLDPPAFLRWLDARTLPFPGEPDRTCDTVAELPDAAHLDRLWALVLEFRSEPDPEILDCLLEYMVRFRREVRHGPDCRAPYWTAAALLNLTGPPQPDLLDMALPGAGDAGLRFRPVVRTLRDDDAAGTLRGIDGGAAGPFCRPSMFLLPCSVKAGWSLRNPAGVEAWIPKTPTPTHNLGVVVLGMLFLLTYAATIYCVFRGNGPVGSAAIDRRRRG